MSAAAQRSTEVGTEPFGIVPFGIMQSMIRTRVFPLSPLQILGGGLLLWHIDRAVKHQRTCPDCTGRDFVAITLDVAHLWKNPQPQA